MRPQTTLTLPHRNITADTIEDAYVSFILYCNPALPHDIDTKPLREAFNNPPRSAGKGFKTFHIFELVKQVQTGEIPSWTQLAIKLGVEPPDAVMGESSQKVTQYGVRLKKWMNSLRLKPFFDYLMGIQNDYWQKIPPKDTDPAAQPVRDGVAIEDDMALRALLPHIRPKRGRKRADDGDDMPYAHRPRLSPSSDAEQGRNEVPQSAHPSRPLHLRSAHPDTPQTPFRNWPNSAITPRAREPQWDESLEPRSAVTPKSGGRLRRGAKNVSSAWTPTVGTGKKRGRPPVDRTPVEESGSSFNYWNPTDGGNSLATTTSEPPTNNEETARESTSGPSTAANAKPTRPSISLQVPKRTGAPVRLATPTEVQSNGAQGPSNQSKQEIQKRLPRRPAVNFFFKNSYDRTNIDTLLSYLTNKCLECQWLHGDGRPTHPGTLEEARAIVNSILSTMHQCNPSPHSFLANLATFAGAAGPLAIPGQRGRCFRLGEDEKTRHYRIEWDYRFGYLSGLFNVTQSVQKSVIEGGGVGEDDSGMDELKKKCEALTGELKKRDGELKKRDDELAQLKRMVESLQQQKKGA